MIDSVVTRVRRALKPENGTGGFAFGRLDRRDAAIVAALVAAFIASRFAWAYLNLDTSLYWEESYRWISALEVLHAPVQPLFDYQADHYQGGSLVMILLSLPLLRVFGESMAVMKLSAILFSSATLSLLYILGRRLFDRATAVIAGLAYLAGPPLVAYWGVSVMGSHNESALFSLLQLLVLFELLSGNWRTPAAWAVFGFIAGAGLWFCYTSGLSLVACGLTWVLLEGLPRRREMAAAMLGALAGLTPWFAYNATRGFVGLRRVVEVFGYGNPIDTWQPQSRVDKVIQLLSHDLPVGLVLPFDGPWPVWVTVFLVAAFALPFTVAIAAAVFRTLGSFVGAPKHNRQTQGWIELVFVVYGVVFLMFFLGSQFTVDRELGAVSYRLFLAPVVLMILPAAHTASIALRSSPGVRRIALAGCVAYLVASACGTVLLATRPVDPIGDEANWISIGSTTRGVLLHRKYEDDLPRALASARLVRDSKLRFRVLQGLGWGIQYRFETAKDLNRIQQDLASIPPQERFAVLSGLRGFANLRLRQLGRRLVSSDPFIKSESSTLARQIAGLVTYAEEQWNRVPPRYRTLDHLPDEAMVIAEGHTDPAVLSPRRDGDWDFKVEVAAAQADPDAKRRFKLLQSVGQWLVACFEGDGDLKRVQDDIDSVPTEVRFAVLSGLRFYASTRLRETQAKLPEAGLSAEDRMRSERLTLLARYADNQWEQIPPQYLMRDWVGNGAAQVPR